MKKFISTLAITIGLPIVYYVVSILMVPIFLIAYCILNKSTIAKINVMEVIMRNTYIIATFVGIVVFLLLILFFLPTKESLFKRCNFKHISFNKIIYIIIFTIGFALLNTIFVAVVSRFFESYKKIGQSLVNTQSSFIELLCVTLLIPIFEEIFFRGVIFGFLKKHYNLVISIIIQALIFAIMHGNMLQGIYTFVFGIILALVNIYSNSLYGNIIAHITFNTFGIIIIPLMANKIPYAALVFLLVGIILITIGIITIINSWCKIKISH